MKYFLAQIVLLLCILPSLVYAICPTTSSDCYTENAGTFTLINAEYATVAATMGDMTAGETMILPAGSFDWQSNQLAITTGINIIGAGKENTLITMTQVAQSEGLSAGIAFGPDAASISNDTPLRISGIGFTTVTGAVAVRLSCSSAIGVSHIRVDNNAFNAMLSSEVPLYVYGQLYGVADNNEFNVGYNSQQGGVKFAGLQGTSWSNTTFNYGSPNNFYFEDNTFNLTNQGAVVISGGQGGRYAARFNTIIQNSVVNLAPAFDSHGNQTSGNFGTMGTEIYRNAISTNRANSIIFFDHRGGRAVAFGNTITGTGTSTRVKVSEEWLDSRVDTGIACADPFNLSLGNSCASDGETQHVTESYFWDFLVNSSVYTATGIKADYDSSSLYPNDPPVLVEDRDFWGGAFSVQTSSSVPFDGTTGVGWGTVSNRPTTCTTGVGYFATDEGSWNNAPDGEQGILYTCSATNTWTAYYTPYTYPHPLRNMAQYHSSGKMPLLY